ncbi:MAG: hypothetical protein JNL08_14690 [Planctomycetes bacterium]|nr:hypothetical protein [Planctomycetota bacterium]
MLPVLLLRCWLLLGCVAAAAVAQHGDRAGEPVRSDVVRRHGITWHFDGPYVVGAFANGDPWVVGPVRIVAIEPKCSETAGRVVHGSMVDPDPSTQLQGYDSALYGDREQQRYRADWNVALGVSRAMPLVLPPDRSLVSVQSRPDPGEAPLLQTAAVLTVVALPPPPDAFRPPYVRGDKRVRHRIVDLDLAALRQLAPLPMVPPIDGTARAFERLWLDHVPGSEVCWLHPRDNMPMAARDLAALVGSAGLQLNLDLPAAQKSDLLVRFVQLGIDLHACLRGGCRWPADGPHGAGRKFPILFAGRLLGDAAMLAIGREFAVAPWDPESGRGGAWFAEDGQTFVVTETAPGVWNGGHGGYRGEHAGLAEWGRAHAERPDLDRAVWLADPDRLTATANGWVGQALAARILKLQDAWAHPPFFAYVDRYLQVPHAEPWQRAWVGWHAAMWDAYRANH